MRKYGLRGSGGSYVCVSTSSDMMELSSKEPRYVRARACVRLRQHSQPQAGGKLELKLRIGENFELTATKGKVQVQAEDSPNAARAQLNLAFCRVHNEP